MWRPGFAFVESELARMPGVHRAPCVYSWVHRGTRENPGIVLGLDRGGSCLGTAFKVAERDRLQTMKYLRERELVTNVYRETERNVVLSSGETVSSVVFVVRRNHDQYAGRLSHDALVERISVAQGKSGPNIEYFINTAEQLGAMGIRDIALQRLAKDLQGQAQKPAA